MSPRKKPAAKPSSAFAEALSFTALILKDKGTVNETHCNISNHWVTAFNGILATGHRIDSDITACPQLKPVIEALAKCGQNVSINKLDTRLSIKSDRFRALIPCVSPELLTTPIPDPPIADIDNRLKEAFEICGLLKTEGSGQDIYAVSILLNGQSMISSLSGSMIIEYWHGLSLPSGLAIPKAFCDVLSKINKKLVKFGFSQWSITLYFEDESWVRSQLYAEQWPEIGQVFNCTNNVQQFPADFWSALKAVAPFGEGLVYSDGKGRLSSHATDNAGASFELLGLLGSWCYPAKQLAALQPFSTHVDFQAQGEHGPMLYAIGKSARAIIAGVRNV